MSKKKPGRRRHRIDQTRSLVRIAQREGMTQQQIAESCRTQQSVVSDWANGKRKAYTHQIDPLLRSFGHLLSRAVFTDYIVEGGRPEWEASPAKTLIDSWCEQNPGPDPVPPRPKSLPLHGSNERTDDEKRVQDAYNEAVELVRKRNGERARRFGLLLSGSDFERALPGFKNAVDLGAGGLDQGVAHATLLARAWWGCAHAPINVVRVPGAMVFRHTFSLPWRDGDSRGRWVRTPCMRWTVHRHADVLWLVEEHARLVLDLEETMSSYSQDQQRYYERGQRIEATEGPAYVLSTSDDAVRWNAAVTGVDSPEDLLRELDEKMGRVLRGFGPHEVRAVRARVRLALVRQGFQIEGVEVLTAAD